MEVPVEMNSSIVAWLSSMGYPVDGMPKEMLRQMLIREARQWQLSPSKLVAMIDDEKRHSAFSRMNGRDAGREASSAGASNWFIGAQG